MSGVFNRPKNTINYIFINKLHEIKNSGIFFVRVNEWIHSCK